MAKIIGVLVVGCFPMMIFTAYLVRGLQLVLGVSKRAMTERVEELGAHDEGIPTPIQLSFNILAYLTALQLPAQWRRFLHPVSVSSLIAVLGVLLNGRSGMRTLFIKEGSRSSLIYIR
ncbi:uncharacterized protein K441DRAFT_663179 [Cenococcum geophilum 1.58]|uniref:uncharacterized protein n=1 Tax=Cenococcum geophilum 1.58 TaxID=794803 RepID=UPI00359021DA|nr:hypothetical protein K441DRAFT_663179 [Cenococcum geophilum 1.58]